MAVRRVSSLADFVAERVPAKSLNLFHTTDGFGFRKVLADLLLKPQYCDKFNENILYLFYGRPAYRVAADASATRLRAALPVCFVLDRKCINNERRIFPFDSGAFINGMYDAYRHPGMDVEDFALRINEYSPERVVSTFFGSNENYFVGVPISGLNVPALSFEADSLYAMLQNESRTPEDDRRSTVEVQVSHEISLNESTIKGVILPRVFLESEYVLEMLDKSYIKIETYEIHHMKIDSYMSSVFEKAKKIMGDIR